MRRYSDELSGQATPLDFMNAYNYAYQQVNKMKCEDPDIIKAVCDSKTTPSPPGGGTCINWQEDKKEMTFPVPANYYINQCNTRDDCEMGMCKDGYCTCETNADCKQGLECIQNPESLDKLICGYAPKTSAGHCVFNNQTACEAQGQPPYTCSSDGCEKRPDSDNKFPYTEWHIDSNTGQGKCVLGNFLLRQWCENPSSRCVKDPESGKYPDQCTQGDKTKGVTDVPAFYYDKNKGMCYMTPDYCHHYDIDYNKPKCTSKADCPGAGDACITDGDNLQKHCVGPDSECSESDAQKAGEFFVGKTLFYMFDKKTTCRENYEEYKNSGNVKVLNSVISDKLKNTSEYACFVYPNKITNKKVLQRDFAGKGINLYLISSSNDSVMIGFDPEEVRAVYLDIVEDHSQGKIICIHRDEIKTDKNLKRIFLTIQSRGWMTNLIVNLTLKNFTANNK